MIINFDLGEFVHVTAPLAGVETVTSGNGSRSNNWHATAMILCVGGAGRASTAVSFRTLPVGATVDSPAVPSLAMRRDHRTARQAASLNPGWVTHGVAVTPDGSGQADPHRRRPWPPRSGSGAAAPSVRLGGRTEALTGRSTGHRAGWYRPPDGTSLGGHP